MTTPFWADWKSIAMDDMGFSKAPLAGNPRVSMKILGAMADGRGECGIWSCTPGERRVVFDHDEFCHFLDGEGRYVSDDGQDMAVGAGSMIYFPTGWAGRSIITKTLTKAFMARS